jgi:periplasmic divalent cation tolerance protein
MRARVRAIVGRMAAHYLVTTTTATKDDATRLASVAVDQRLAACGQVSGPITSVYRWHDRVEHAEEWVCTFKTSAATLGALRDALRGAHSYTTPEIVALAIEDGDPEYLAWIDAETATPP